MGENLNSFSIVSLFNLTIGDPFCGVDMNAMPLMLSSIGDVQSLHAILPPTLLEILLAQNLFHD